MELEGKIWKNKNHWLVEVSSLNIITQGETREEALFMIKDAIIEYIKYYFEFEVDGFELTVNEYKKSVIGITANNNKLLLALSLRRQRKKWFNGSRSFFTSWFKVSKFLCSIRKRENKNLIRSIREIATSSKSLSASIIKSYLIRCSIACLTTYNAKPQLTQTCF